MLLSISLRFEALVPGLGLKINEKEIKMFLTDRYGEYILFKPYFSLKNLLLWIFPFLILLVSLGFFARNLKKNLSS